MPVLWWLIASAIIAGVLVIKILGEITKDKISSVVDFQGTIEGKSLYATIKEIQPDKVKFSMYDKHGNHVKNVEMSSVFDTVDWRIKIGDKIY